MTFESARRVLVVEDDPAVAMVVEETLRNMGVDVLVDLSLVNALSDLESSEFDAALIEQSLRGESAHPLILALIEQGVPFAVMSGGDLSALAAQFPRVPMMSKPLDMKSLEKAVEDLLRMPAPSRRYG
ncbi:hypothetical protein ASG87_06440 [Frateuria sp. Soil773]|uniref:response regulator n=1 Tax=Frateuria sp. Soil773 TaxID=1736407 RepID=UPI0006FD415F|nr:response regulator [Frateuria sp. Soil773]KRE89164.1 hypothetical protein ASG87_06440 [Frateuria sp. Soil773]